MRQKAIEIRWLFLMKKLDISVRTVYNSRREFVTILTLNKTKEKKT